MTNYHKDLTGAELHANANLTGDVTSVGNATTIAAGARLKSKVKTFSRDLTAASGDVAYTGVGFTPTAVIGIGAIQNVFEFVIGIADSAKAASQIEPYTANTMQETNTRFLDIATSAGNDQGAIVKSYDADGFTLTWTKSGTPTGTAELAVLCFN